MIAITSRVVGTWCHRRRDKKNYCRFILVKSQNRIRQIVFE